MFLVVLTGLVGLTGLISAVSPLSSAQVTLQDQRDPTACAAIGPPGTNCQGAFLSDNAYASSSLWYHADWRFRKKVVFNATRVTGDLGDFPALIRISDPDLRDDAQEDGDDILFTQADGLAKLSHEIERFDGTTGELSAWVKVTSLSPTVDTGIYMYYGHPTVDSQEDATGVWDSRYVGVYHLKETPDGSLGDVRDSTQRGNHGTSSGMSAADQVPGQIGGSLHFEAASSVKIPADASLKFQDGGFVSAWFNSDVDLNYVPGGDTPGSRVLVERGDSFFLYYDSAHGRFTMQVYHAGGYTRYHTRLDGSEAQNVSAGEWHHVAFMFNKTNGWAYYDGAFRGGAASAYPGQEFRTGDSMTLGARNWEGQLDEVRVSDVADESGRLGAWIATGHSNQRYASTFCSVGVEETKPTFDYGWRNFGFNLNVTDTVERVEIGVEWFRNNAAPILNVTVSWDGGTTWAANQTASNQSTDDDTLQFLDFTPAVPWASSLLNDANLRARAGTNASGANLDHIAVRVTFTPALPPEPDAAPVVVTLEATNVTQASAILRGSLVDLGSATDVQVSFEWGLSPALGSETARETLRTPSILRANLDGLSPGTTFYYRVRAVGNETAFGETLTLQTMLADTAPMVVTLEPVDVTRHTAILRGSLGDLGSAASVQISFEWGLSPGLGEETAPETIHTPATFQASLEALKPGTVFYFRTKAVGNGTALGEMLTFQTAPPAPALDLVSQLWIYLPLVGVALLIAFLMTRRLVGASQRRKFAKSPPGAGAVDVFPGGLVARVGRFPSLGPGRSRVQEGGQEAPFTASTATKVSCPHCAAPLEAEAVYCYACGRGLTEVIDSTMWMEPAEGPLEQNARNQSTVVTVGIHPAPEDEEQEATELLNRLEEAASGAIGETAEDGGLDGPGSCLYCGTTVEPETGDCPECGRSALDSGGALEENVTKALARLELAEDDTVALFTLGTSLLLDGRAREALDALNRLTLLDPDYPGLWRVKALVFEKLGNKGAAESALVQAQRRSGDLGEDAE